jgi:formylglycine-generating enzyme required for sulfatase activity
LIEIPEGRTTLGKDRGDGFGWDNEFEAHDVFIGRFAIDRYKVTNGNYLEFVLEGAPPPHFWTQRSGKWFYRGMFGNRPLPLSSPVYVTHQEATEYARWRHKKLPSEGQFHRAAYCTQSGEQHRYPWGDAEPSSSHGNFGFQFWDPVSVHSAPAGESAWGVSQLVGNGWEWTSTEFGPFPGFHSEPNYPGYSSNFFDGKHYVLKGASPRTAHCFLRRSFRNWFRADYPYVYATFRCVED